MTRAPLLFSLLCFLCAACAALWTPADTAAVKQSGIEQLHCVDEAGTRAEADACKCNVRARYPEGPQCDGGAP